MIDPENSSWSESPVILQVTNHSNQSISADFAWKQIESSKVINVTGKFTSDAAGKTALTANRLVLDSAATNNAETSATAYFFITGGSLDKGYEGTIGNITITIGANG